MNIEAAKARLAYALQRTMDDLAHDGRKWPVESEAKNCDKCIGNWNCERGHNLGGLIGLSFLRFEGEAYGT